MYLLSNLKEGERCNLSNFGNKYLARLEAEISTLISLVKLLHMIVWVSNPNTAL